MSESPRMVEAECVKFGKEGKPFGSESSAHQSFQNLGLDGDVWGIFVAIYGTDNEYTYAELKEIAKLLRRELLLVKDVAKIEFNSA